MAELQKNIRRVGGELVSARQPYGRRLLLPSEIELCKTLGLCEDEYWYFVDQTAAYNGQRPKAYNLVPDINNELVSTVAGVTTLTATGQVVLAVALTAIGYLLTPKPKPLKAGEIVQGADSIGSKRFAPQFAFNSLQELANIGDTIPLVFTNFEQVINISSKGTTRIVRGGIRVNGQLLWSQFLSLGRLQQLKALFLFSLGEVESRPEFAGYAIGDLLLSSYSQNKLDLYFKSSLYKQTNRIGESDAYSDSKIVGHPYPYPNDIFADVWPVNSTEPPLYPFSGTRNPTTQVAFGTYSPLSNANVVKLPWQLNQYVRKTSNDAKRGVATKEKKTNTFWPTRAGFTGGSNPNDFLGAVGNTLTYRVLKSSQTPDDTYETGFKPHGAEDVVSMIRGIREQIDNNIAVGETYLAGDAIVSCTNIKTLDGEEGVPWRPTTILNGLEMYAGIERQYIFEVEETGQNYESMATGSFRNPNLFEHAAQPKYLTQGAVEINGVKVQVHQDMSETSLQYGFAYRNPILQRVAIGTVTNSRVCSMTEIGLKSKVFSSIRGANLNSVPEQSELTRMFDDKVNFQLGDIDQYIKRFSFFYFQMRQAGTNNDWETLFNKEVPNHSGLFCVRGNTPEFQYNYISVNHSANTLYEFRFKPYPGNNIPILHLGQKVNLLNARLTNERQQKQEFLANTTKCGNVVVSFAGDYDFVLKEAELFNTEWKLSFKSGTPSPLTGGPVTDIDNRYDGVDDLTIPLNTGRTRDSIPNYTPNYEYDYVVEDNGSKDITLISLDKFHDVGDVTGHPKWAYIAYVDGVEVGYTIVDAGTPTTDVLITNKDDPSLTYIPNNTIIEDEHPEDTSQDVEYYKLDEFDSDIQEA